MPKCPKCGAEVVKPIKTWILAPKGRKGVIIGLFKCPNGHYFRAKIDYEDISISKPSPMFKNVIASWLQIKPKKISIAIKETIKLEDNILAEKREDGTIVLHIIKD